MCEIRYALLDDIRDFSGDMTFAGTLFVGVCDYFGDAERSGVERCLRNETIGKWDSKETGDACSET